MKHQNLLLLFMPLVLNGFGQQRLITCSSERNADNTISIYADAQISGEYTLKFTFTAFQGYTVSLMSTYHSGSSEIGLATVFRGRREVAKLTPVKNASMYAMSYQYTYYPGTTVRKAPDSTFVYLLPGTEGTRLRVSGVTYVGERLGQKSQENFSAIGFIYKLGDTICASRAGTVYDCSDAIKEGEKGSEWYKRDRNRIHIQQKDGTLANYSILSPIQLLVAPGDYVVPGQPLAVFNKTSEKYHVLFSVYYLDEKKTLVDNTNSSSERLPSAYTYLSTAFYMDPADRAGSPAGLEIRKEYITAHPKEIVATELSKKDKKETGIVKTPAMKDPDIEQLLKDGKGYDLNFAHVMEFLMARTIANSFLSAEIVKRQIELEQLIKTDSIDHEKAALECDALCKQVSDLATTEKNNVISQLYFMNKEGQ